jgi:hypothetical protein
MRLDVARGCEMEMNVENVGNENIKPTVPSTDCDGSKQLDNVEHFNDLCSLVTNDSSCTREIKSRIPMAKQHSIRRGPCLPGNWT